jgi:hypothetical protein
MAETLNFTIIWAIGRANAQVPLHASATKNWALHICEVATTRNNVNHIAKKLDPSKEWVVIRARITCISRLLNV